jgi:hypothetical protein
MAGENMVTATFIKIAPHEKLHTLKVLSIPDFDDIVPFFGHSELRERSSSKPQHNMV